jgi:feruloyl-CoA synthase
VVERHPDGTLFLRSPHELGPYPLKLTERLEHWAAEAPDRVLFAQRDAAGGWRSVTYAAALDQARRIGEALLRRGLTPERPIAILSGNDIEHALLGLAALTIGIPYVPISPA